MKLYIPKVIDIEVNYINMNLFYTEDIPLVANESSNELLNWDRVRSKFMDFVRDLSKTSIFVNFIKVDIGCLFYKKFDSFSRYPYS